MKLFVEHCIAYHFLHYYMRRILCVGLVLGTMLLSADTWTDSSTGITWQYTVDDGGAAIVYGDSYSNKPAISPATSGTLKIPSVINGYPVKSIGAVAFYRCYNLTSVTIPSSVTNIGYNAFYECNSLVSVTIPSSVRHIGSYAFWRCGGLVSVSIPSSVTVLDYGVFRSCGGLKSITIPSSVTEIAPYAFLDCSGLMSVSIPSSVTKIGTRAFEGCVELTSVKIPSSVTTVGDSAFAGCSGIRNATVPGWKCNIDFANVTNLVIAPGTANVRENAFSGCTALMSVKIPTSVKSIGKGAFGGCSALTSVAIPSGVANIDRETFYGCRNLRCIAIPSSVTSIGDWAFSSCSSLVSLSIPANVTSLGQFAFSSCTGLTSVAILSCGLSVNLAAFLNCKSISAVTVPGWRCDIDFANVTNLVVTEGASSIADAAFRDLKKLTSVTIPQSVTSIGSCAFEGCSGLTSITVPSGVRTVGDDAFHGCMGLTSLVIQDGVANIGMRAFCGCNGLTSVSIPPSVTDVGLGAFDDCAHLESIVVPFLSPKGLGDMFTKPSAVKGLYFAGGISDVCCLADGLTKNCPELEYFAIPETVGSLGDNDFRDTKLAEGKSGLWIENGWVMGYVGEAPAAVDIPEGVTGIASYAFEGQFLLESVTFPNTLKYIGVNAFRGCTGLGILELPDGLEHVDDGAFRDCTWIQEIEFPSSLTNIGKMAFANCSSLAGIECTYGLEEIGEGSFSNCWRMQSVELPASVDAIGARAFYNCKNVLGITVPAHVDTIAHLFPDVYQKLQSVYIAEGETELTAGVFSGCQLLEEVELSDAIQEIPDSTFEGCSLLRSIRFPNELVRIGNKAFYGCGQIWQLEFPQGLTEIGDDAFNGVQWVQDLVCPASVRRIGARAFRGVWNDIEVKLPVGLEWLGVDAFANCSDIRKISLPAVTTPIKSAFPAAYSKIESVKILGAPMVIPTDFCRDVVSLSGIEIPASVTSIGNYAFSGLSNLAAIELPPNLETIGEYAFNGDSRFVTVALPQSLTSVGYRAFYGCGNVRIVSCSGELATLSTLFPSAYGQITTVSINKGTTRLMDDLLSGCSKLSEIDVPLGVTSIGARAFQNCTALTAFGVPQGVVSLGADVFSGCTGLTAMSLPEGLTSIPSGAFRNCRAIASLVIPSSVTYLGPDAFNGCTALKSISYLGSCPTFDSGCYNGTPSDLASHVVFGSRGWDGVPTSKTLPEYWPTTNVRTIDYWEPITFEATFDGNGGTPASANVVQTTGMTYVLPEDDPTMKGARFNGWWTQRINGGRIKSTTKVEVTRAQTFYAHWKYNEYAVRFDANGGFGEMDDLPLTVNTAAELTKNAFLRKGYRFAGWALSPEGEAELSDGAEVENLSFEHNAVVSLYAVWEEQNWGAAEYLNIPGREFAFEGDADWVADDEVSHDGVGSMRSGAIAAAEEGQRTQSVMKTVVVGTGSGSFWWKVDCEPADESVYYDYCLFTIDGTEVAKIAGTNDWEIVDYEITGEGEHELEWTFTRDDWDEDESLYENAAWVDEFAWTPTPVTLSFDANGAEGEVPSTITKYAGCEVTLPSPSLLMKNGFIFVGWSDGEKTWHPGDAYALGASDTVLRAVWEEKVWTLEEAAGLTGLTLTTGGDVVWTVDLTTNYDGIASLRSGVIGDSQSTWVSMSVTGPGTISFRTLVSGEYYRGKLCDYLKFEVDGESAFASYDASWSNVVVEVSGKGSHVLKWTYLKNASKSAGYDCAWLDEIVWTSTTSYTVHFNANGGTGTMDDQTFALDEAKALSPCSFTREGFIFGGWKLGDGDELIADGAVVSNLTDVVGDRVELSAFWRRPDGGPYTEVVDGIKWTYSAWSGVACLEGYYDWDTGDSVACIANDVAGNLVIPSTLGGCRVECISEYAFIGCYALTSIRIPSSVTWIISDSCNAFNGCDQLTSIFVDSENKGYTSVDGVLYSKDLKGLLRCPPGKGGEYTFSEKTEYLEWHAFDGCRELTKVNVTKNVRDLGLSTFEGCNSLAEIAVVADNPYYESIDGAVYCTRDQERWLYRCPPGRKGAFEVVNGVDCISIDAFSDCTLLTSVAIPASVSYIENESVYFHECTSLTSIEVDQDNENYASVDGLLYDARAIFQRNSAGFECGRDAG